MIKYSIIINPMGNSYALVVDSWIENDGKKTDAKGFSKINLQLSEAFILIQEFINENSK
ncbi:MAG TPA: hypothetical protein PKH02_01960 [Bacteroidales bacterium]|nr:hypothetical protein [Bacteroidales bacterium]